MYEARQHKDKVSRLNKKPEKKKMRIISPKVAQCDTKDDPFEYGYCFYNKHLSISSGNDLIQESINCRDTTLINEGSLSWKSHATLTLLAMQDCPLWLQYD